MTVTKNLLKASVLVLAALALQAPAQAQGVPEIKPILKKMLGGLQINGLKESVQGMVAALRKTSCGGNLSGCFATQTPDGKLQLYFFTDAKAQQTLLLVVNEDIGIPKTTLPPKVQKALGGTRFGTPIISLSTTSFDLVRDHMPPALQTVIRERYFNVPSMNFEAGAQMAANAKLGGVLKMGLQRMGVTGVNEVTARIAMVIPIPTDAAGGAGTGIGIARDVSDGDTLGDAGAKALKPEVYVELQLAPNSVVDFNQAAMRLTDATFFLNYELTFGFKGNAMFKGLENKPMIVQFQTPLNPESGLDLLDFMFFAATPPKFTLEDQLRVLAAVYSSPPPMPGDRVSGYVNRLKAYMEPMMVAAKPLSAFQLINPLGTTEYQFGNPQKPFPTRKQFNLVALGPLAEGGPYLSATGDLRILGQKMGWIDAKADIRGINGVAGAGLHLKLGPLGRLPINMQSTIALDQNKQITSLTGNLAGQKVSVTFGSKIGIEVNASCVNPFEIKASVDFKPDLDLERLFEAQGGANVDPSKISGCVGKELEAAYRKVAGEFKNLSGYTAKEANAQLNRISEEAEKEYNRVKNGARDVANKATNGAANAFNEAGNAFKKIGKKKKHKKKPDQKFAASVFDWDYYYDAYPDLVKAGVDLREHWRDTGFAEGRRGSLEFHTEWYWGHYADVQALCPNKDWACTLQHWIDDGLEQGRQGSPDVSIESYVNRFSAFKLAKVGKLNYLDAMEEWLNSDGSGNAKPAVVVVGPLAGIRTVGGDKENPWSDLDFCAGQPLTGWRLSYNNTVDRVQFYYENRGWSAVQGGKDKFKVDMILPAGEYVTRVDYRSGVLIDSIAFITNRGRNFGPYGGNGGSFGSYSVSPGEKLSCLSGRAAGSINQLIFMSTGPR